jgi:hypothetical protein
MKTNQSVSAAAKMGAEIIPGLLASIRKATLEYGESGRCRNCDTKKGCNREVAPLKQRFSTRCNRMAVSDAVCVI